MGEEEEEKALALAQVSKLNMCVITVERYHSINNIIISNRLCNAPTTTTPAAVESPARYSICGLLLQFSLSVQEENIKSMVRVLRSVRSNRVSQCS